MAGPNIPVVKGISANAVRSIPKVWDPQWFARFITDHMQKADYRNAIAGPGITITGTEQTTGEISSSGFAITAAEIAAGVTPTNYFYMPGNVLRYGASGNGTTDNTAAFTSANSIGDSLYIPQGTYLISSNLTLSVPLTFDYLAILKPANGTTTTINAAVNAGPWQIFNESLGGVISGLIEPVNADGRAYFEWEGAAGDGTTDDTVACQATLRLASTANYIGVQMLPKKYKLTAALYVNGTSTASFFAPSIYGVGNKESQFVSTTTSIYLLIYTGGSGKYCDGVIDSVGFSAPTSNCIALQINGQCGLRFRRCMFDTQQAGIQFWNKSAGAFSEFNVAENCEFTSNCQVPVYYTFSTGASNSFHGSGLIGCTISAPGAGPFIQVQTGARPYQAPLDVTVFFNTNATLINNASSALIDFKGNICTENVGGTATLTLGTGNNIPYVGDISATTQTVVAGTLTQMQGVFTDSSGVQTYIGERKAYNAAMTTGANTLSSYVPTQHRLVFVRFTAANYEYRYLLGVDFNNFGGAGYVGTIVNYIALNTAGYGAPTFTVNTSGQLIATNANWPASGVTAYWGEITVGFGNESSPGDVQF